MAILLTAVVYLYLEFFSSGFYYHVPGQQNGSEVKVIGKVWSKTFKPGFNKSLLPVIHIIPQENFDGAFELVECYLEPGDSELPSIGEYVEVCGKLKVFMPPTNPGEFDSRLYYSTMKISYRLTGAEVLRKGGDKDSYRETLFRIRMFFEEALDRVLDEQDAAIMKAMILGDKAYMDDEIKDIYKSSGIMHILAVSGLHISMIGMGLYELLKKLVFRMAGMVDGILTKILGESKTGGMARRQLPVCKILPALLSILFMYSYGVMCGMGTSSFRAIMMFTLRLLAPVLGRTYDILTALALSEILLVLDQPLYLYNSGFLFSFGAILGITALKPALEKLALPEDEGKRMHFAGDEDRNRITKKVLNHLKEGLISGISIMIMTLPVYMSFYYTYPLYSLFLNLLVIPVMTILMIVGLSAMVLGSLGRFFAWSSLSLLPGFISGKAVHAILSLYRICCETQIRIPGNMLYLGHTDKWRVVVYYFLVTVFIILMNRIAKSDEKKTAAEFSLNSGYVKRALGVLTIASMMIILIYRAPVEFRLTMIDVDQGDGILISTGNEHILIDGGSTGKKNIGKYSIIPCIKYEGIGVLDAVIVSHEDSDHINGIMEIMDDMAKGGVRIKNLILPDVALSSRGDNYRELEQRAKELGITTSYISSGECFYAGEAQFLCLNPALKMSTEGANAYSTVLYMNYHGYTALYTGDMEEEGLEQVKGILRENPQLCDIDLLKVAHHGSRYTTDEEFLELTDPELALISCGRDNSYGHPHRELLERLEAVHAKVFRTDKSGAITVYVRKKGKALEVETEEFVRDR